MSLTWLTAVAYDPNHPSSGKRLWDDEDEIDVPPEDYGYHCGDHCWEEATGKVDYKSDEYAKANHPETYGGVKWSEKPVETHPLPRPLHAVQEHVNPEVVDHYRSGGGPEARSGDVPCILKWQGKHFVKQGTHRLAAAMERGDTHYVGKYHDLDEELGR